MKVALITKTKYGFYIGTDEVDKEGNHKELSGIPIDADRLELNLDEGYIDIDKKLGDSCWNTDAQL